MSATIPSFSRVEIRHGSRKDLLATARQLRALAARLEDVANTNSDDETATIIAHNRIREASQVLRGTSNGNY